MSHTMSPRRGAAPAGSSSRGVSSRIQKKLLAGLSLLKEPCSEAAADAVINCLEAAIPSARRPHGPQNSNPFPHDNDAPRILQLLNRYLQWFVSGQPALRSAVQAATTPNTRGSINSTSSSRMPGDSRPAFCSAREGGLLFCLARVYDIVSAAVMIGSQEVKAAIRPQLLAAGTGEALPYGLRSVATMCCSCLAALDCRPDTATPARCAAVFSPTQHARVPPPSRPDLDLGPSKSVIRQVCFACKPMCCDHAAWWG